MGQRVSKSIAIIGEGETELFYFDSLRIAHRYPFKVAPGFPQHSDINHILKLVESYLNKQYDYIVCLFDMDRLFQQPSEMQLYQWAKKKYTTKSYAGRVLFVETNPCTEFWFLLHFLPNVVCRRYESYEQRFRNKRSSIFCHISHYIKRTLSACKYTIFSLYIQGMRVIFTGKRI